MTVAPTSEIGFVGRRIPRWSELFADEEPTPDLRWPKSINVFEQMRNDAHLEGLLYGLLIPIISGTWKLDPNGAREEAIPLLAHDLGVEILGRESEQRKARPKINGEKAFSLKNHLYQALNKSLTFGHMYFEVVGDVIDGKWRLVKLAARDPQTIKKIGVEERSGNLTYIEQAGLSGRNYKVRIPEPRLLPFIWEQGDGNWVGRSLFRSCYRNWKVKDHLIRIDAINLEKAGGTHIAEGFEGATDKELEQLSELAQGIRVGEDSGAAVPHGSVIHTLKVGGGGSGGGALGTIRWHDEQMSKRFQATFTELATAQHGSRALGDVLIDWHTLAQEYVADFYAEAMNNEIISDWMTWNYGESEEYLPRLVYALGEGPELTIEEYDSLVSNGTISPDTTLEEYFRDRFGLPAADEPAPGATRGDLSDSSRLTGRASLPSDRKLRRQPTAMEIAAQVDFARVEEFHNNERDSLLDIWLETIRPEQLNEAAELVLAADGDIEALAAITIEPSPAGEAVLLAAAITALAEGIDQATEEASDQGVSLDTPDLEEANESLKQFAAATNLILAAAITVQIREAAIQRSGATVPPSVVEKAIRTDLAIQGAAYIRDQLSGHVAQATSTGRTTAMRAVPADTEVTYLATELLDRNTCGPCTSIDGSEYDSIDESLQDYPTGQYSSCEGRRRCRGFVAAVYG